MLILFDIDDTLLDHRVSERSAAALLHRSIGAAASFEECLVKWTAASERHFARYLAGEVSLDGQRRDRVREMVDSGLSDEFADRLGVISNGQGVLQRRKLAQTGIADRYECIVISRTNRGTTWYVARPEAGRYART